MDDNVSVLKLLAIISPALVGDYGEIVFGWTGLISNISRIPQDIVRKIGLQATPKCEFCVETSRGVEGKFGVLPSWDS